MADPRISDEQAEEIFEAHRSVVKLTIALNAMKEQVKTARETLDDAYALLNSLIARAEAGQGVLFVGPGEKADGDGE